MPRERSCLATLFQLYGAPGPFAAAAVKAARYLRDEGIGGLVRALRRKLAYPTLPVDVPRIEDREGLAFEERWVLRGAGLTRLHSTTIIILTKGNQGLLDTCLASLARSLLPDAQVEILIVNNGGSIAVPTEFPFPLRILRETRRFNWAAYNNRAAEQARGEFLLFLNDDVEALHGGWLDAMLAEGTHPQVGAVGAKLLYPDGRIQHCGFLVEAGQLRDLYKLLDRHEPETSGSISPLSNVDAVSGACLLTRRAIFHRYKFDERFAYNYNDVDYCLRIKKYGGQVVVTPYAELIHYETKTRPLRISTREARLMEGRWFIR